MSERKRLVLDANILLRAVFGMRVRTLIEDWEDAVDFYSPDVCFDDAREYIPDIVGRRGFDLLMTLAVLQQIATVVQVIGRNLYEQYEKPARSRISQRHPEDWPVVATALLLDAPIWTEDQDFFGVGVATWTTDRIELHLRGNQ